MENYTSVVSQSVLVTHSKSCHIYSSSTMKIFCTMKIEMGVAKWTHAFDETRYDFIAFVILLFHLFQQQQQQNSSFYLYNENLGGHNLKQCKS